MQINSNFDGGNIRLIRCEEPQDIQLEIETDRHSDFYQWFYFRLTGARDTPCTLKLINAGGAAYTKGWEDYQAVASYDRHYWFRVPTRYADGVLSIEHQPDFDSVFYAYFAPYSIGRCTHYLGSLLDHPQVALNLLGETLDGQDLEQLIIGEPEAGRKKIWVHARQHPGETMASWWMEGFLDRLLHENDPVARALLTKAVFYVVPNMNPDGSKRGHLRTNAAGANLNREWLQPSMEKSPEVYLLRENMQAIGVDFCLDVHGDEALPYNFIAGTHGIPGWDDRRLELHNRFGSALQRANPDFQTAEGYPENKPGTADLSMCTNWVAEHLNCLAITLEMPFKDTVETPRPMQGWSAERSYILGASGLDAIYAILDDL